MKEERIIKLSVETQLVIDNLQKLKIDGTEENITCLLGSILHLKQLRDILKLMEEKTSEEKMEDNQNGSDDGHESAVSEESNPE